MKKLKIAVSLDESLVQQLDELVANDTVESRSQFLQLALMQSLKQLRKKAMYEACSKLSASDQVELAELGADEDIAAWSK